MRRRRYQNRAQLVLELERQTPQQPPWATSPKGLIEALADLLLEAMGAEKVMKTGGADEHQDHT